jgi:hypothetical protein
MIYDNRHHYHPEVSPSSNTHSFLKDFSFKHLRKVLEHTDSLEMLLTGNVLSGKVVAVDLVPSKIS